jgi:hypothetical protein
MVKFYYAAMQVDTTFLVVTVFVTSRTNVDHLAPFPSRGCGENSESGVGSNNSDRRP